jgi:glycosyltransferase
MLPFLLKELFTDDDEIVFHFNHSILHDVRDNLQKLFNCKFLFTVHYTDWGLDLYGDSRKLFSLLDKAKKGHVLSSDEQKTVDSIRKNREIFQQADLTVFLAQHTVQIYSKISLLQDTNHTIVNNGLKDRYKKMYADQKRAVRKRYQIPEHETILFFAGFLGEKKGIYCLIEAFKEVVRSKPDTRLIIAGEGNFPQLLAKSRFACTQITFTGLLDKSEMTDFYRIADIGIACSMYEEFGLVAVEMMMHKLPVIVTDTGGLAEIIDDHVNGLKVPVVSDKGKRMVDRKQLAATISFLIDYPDERLRLGENARKKFLANYELSIFSSKMIQIYNAI